ncbi:hypothetical protein E05_37050 [Plautia stali symbiont]|nr:hypothetical protein E05_37050 [Plautia stali symbiont]
MRTTSSLLALLWLAFATPGYAADLSAQLTQFFQARDPHRRYDRGGPHAADAVARLRHTAAAAAG